ncbi:MAG: Holliday junction resolvase RuvX [Burkholderiales bacterium]|nr:Holliday junction resolvase RuvX [Burkholderiales bacterium]OJX06157.1 MAG: Holliday junction DNA helicase RuvA [Burkholderiales bacterium 70-64]
MAETLLGFDFGTYRIGVAIGNTLTGSARALAIVASEPTADRWAAIAALVSEWQPQRLVVGRPRHFDGDALAVTARCERFARQLAGRLGLPVALVDESYSSAEARTTAGRGRPVDAEAAAVILRQYLSSR